MQNNIDATEQGSEQVAMDIASTSCILSSIHLTSRQQHSTLAVLGNISTTQISFTVYGNSLRRSRASVAGSQDTYKIRFGDSASILQITADDSPLRGGSTIIQSGTYDSMSHPVASAQRNSI